MNTTETANSFRPDLMPQNSTASTTPNSQVAPRDLGRDAQNERAHLVRAFQAWVVQQRIELERTVHRHRQHARNCAPFARVALDALAQDANPEAEDAAAALFPVVWEFCETALQILEDQALLDVLNTVYFDCAQPVCDSDLSIDNGNAAAVRQLWDWFQSEQEASD